MCGILGYIGNLNATNVLLDGLKRLEYRGYDSAGVVIHTKSGFQLRRSVGKLGVLETQLRDKPLEGPMGLGHTRWATHGAPTETNAHPHSDETGKIVVVHNGIIENYLELKDKLKTHGFAFRSETDTEVVSHLIRYYCDQTLSSKTATLTKDIFLSSIQKALKDIRGTFALGIVCAELPDLIVGARRDCPLIVGLGTDQNFLASDVPAILSYTRDVVFLEDGDLALLTKDNVQITDIEGKPVKRPVNKISWDPVQAEKAGYKHFMLKEIHEQPRVVENTLLGRLDTRTGDVDLSSIGLKDDEIKALTRIRFVACGTSWHASLIGSYLIEKHTGLPSYVDIASEFRYKDPIVEPGTLVVAVSQSGETADTLAALRLAKQKGARVLAVTNVVGSTMMRDAQMCLLTHCGPEIGVASTKAFMGQLVAMHLLMLHIARVRKSQASDSLRTMGKNLVHLSQWITQTLECEKSVIAVAKKYFRVTDFLYLGRNVNYPVALEGALKLKEISYIHAEGYPAGEMKHGPIALIDEKLPVVSIVTKSSMYDKMVSNIEEAKSRGAHVIALATKGDTVVKDKAHEVIYVPDVPEDLSPLVNVIPLQILAYEIAVNLGCDVDQPRNLAKSVTVE